MEARCSLFERFSENLKPEPRQVICMENLLETAWLSLRVGWCTVSENHQGRTNSISQNDGAQIRCLSVGSVREGSEKEQLPLPELLCGRKLPLQFLPWCRPIQFWVLDTFWYLHICPWYLLSCAQRWSSEPMSPSKSVCGPIKRNICVSSHPQSYHHKTHEFLQPEVLGTSFPGTGALGWGAWYGAGITWFFKRFLWNQDIPPIFIHHTWMWDQPSPYLCPFYSLSVASSVYF